MPKSITDLTYVGSKAYNNYIKLLKKKYRENKIYEILDSKRYK
jgi:hypothetical protein